MEPVDVHQAERFAMLCEQITNIVERRRLSNAVGAVEKDDVARPRHVLTLGAAARSSFGEQPCLWQAAGTAASRVRSEAPRVGPEKTRPPTSGRGARQQVT